MTSQVYGVLSTSSAHFLAAFIASSYVIAVYLSRLVSPGKRDDPLVIRTRLIAVTASTFVACCVTSLFLSDKDASFTLSESFTTLGFTWNSSWITTIRQCLIVPSLFLGPLFATFLSGRLPFQSNWTFWEDVQLTSIHGLRNFIFAPITEEITYRACLLSTYSRAGFSRRFMIWLAPCWFGLAHVHHGIETYKTLGRTSRALKIALMSAAFQFLYTTLFGWITSFLFLRTGSIYVAIFAHIFCNIMGFPDIMGQIRDHPRQKFLIIGAYVVGISLFASLLWSWSYNPDSIYWKPSIKVDQR